MSGLDVPRVKEALIAIARDPEDAAGNLSDLTEPERQAVLAAAVRQGIGLAAAVAMQRAGLAVPRWLEDHRFAAATQRLGILRALEEMTPVLNAAGMGWVVLKGPVTASFFDRPELREFVDLDLLVAGSDVAAALEAFEVAGAERVNRNWSAYLRHGVAEFPVQIVGAPLDVHWSLVPLAKTRRQFRLDIGAMLDRRRTIAAPSAGDVPALDPVDNLLHLCLHAGLSGGNRLGWLRDIAAVARRDDLDWDVFVDRARFAGVAPMAGQVLDRTARTLGLCCPPDVPRRLVSHKALAARRWLDDRPRPWARSEDRLYSGLPVGPARPGLRRTLMAGILAGYEQVRARLGAGRHWSAFDPAGPLFWGHEDDDPRSRDHYLVFAQNG